MLKSYRPNARIRPAPAGSPRSISYTTAMSSRSSASLRLQLERAASARELSSSQRRASASREARSLLRQGPRRHDSPVTLTRAASIRRRQFGLRVSAAGAWRQVRSEGLDETEARAALVAMEAEVRGGRRERGRGHRKHVEADAMARARRPCGPRTFRGRAGRRRPRCRSWGPDRCRRAAWRGRPSASASCRRSGGAAQSCRR